MYTTNLIKHFDHKLINQAVEYCRSQLPYEACGIFTDDEFIPYENVAEDRLTSFRIEEDLYSNDEVKCIIHSHNDSPACSYRDKENQQNMGIPYGIINFKDEITKHVIFFGDTLEIEPLKGRPYFWAAFDCLTLVRDYYRINYDILLPDPPKKWGFWEDDIPMFEGFLKDSKQIHIIELHEAEEGDILLYNSVGKYINHCGILLDGGLALHQFVNRLSATYPIKIFRDSLHSIYRRTN